MRVEKTRSSGAFATGQNSTMRLGTLPCSVWGCGSWLQQAARGQPGVGTVLLHAQTGMHRHRSTLVLPGSSGTQVRSCRDPSPLHRHRHRAGHGRLSGATHAQEASSDATTTQRPLSSSFATPVRFSSFLSFVLVVFVQCMIGRQTGLRLRTQGTQTVRRVGRGREREAPALDAVEVAAPGADLHGVDGDSEGGAVGLDLLG
jgi:hypothetical protein